MNTDLALKLPTPRCISPGSLQSWVLFCTCGTWKPLLLNFSYVSSTADWNTCNLGSAWRCAKHPNNFKVSRSVTSTWTFFPVNDLHQEGVCRWGILLPLPSMFTFTVTLLLYKQTKKGGLFVHSDSYCGTLHQIVKSLGPQKRNKYQQQGIIYFPFWYILLSRESGN